MLQKDACVNRGKVYYSGMSFNSFFLNKIMGQDTCRAAKDAGHQTVSMLTRRTRTQFSHMHSSKVGINSGPEDQDPGPRTLGEPLITRIS